jgi:hypothetical protein
MTGPLLSGSYLGRMAVRHGVETVASQGVAAGEATGAQPASAQEAKACNGLRRVVGTAWHVPATAGKPRRKQHFIRANEDETHAGRAG